jgi:hypothetical protein
MERKLEETKIDTSEFRHLRFEKKGGQHIVSLVDSNEYQILRGYGGTIIEAINDLHSGIL